MKVVKRTITYTSSTDAPASISCGIPLLVPYFSSISLTILGTTTAGDTAAKTAPMIADSSNDKPSNPVPSISIPASSKVAGTKHIIMAGLPILLSPDISRLSPALVRIMINAIFLKSADIASGKAATVSETAVNYVIYDPQQAAICEYDVNGYLNKFVNSKSLLKSRLLASGANEAASYSTKQLYESGSISRLKY